MVTLNWTFNSKGDHLTIFNWIKWVPYFIFNFGVTHAGLTLKQDITRCQQERYVVYLEQCWRSCQVITGRVNSRVTGAGDSSYLPLPSHSLYFTPLTSPIGWRGRYYYYRKALHYLPWCKVSRMAASKTHLLRIVCLGSSDDNIIRRKIWI